MFDRKGPLDVSGFEGSGADWMPQYKKYIEDGETIVCSPHKVYGPEQNDLVLQLRKVGIDKVILAGMLGAFGQIPINDYMIGKTASGPYKARIYGVRYVVSFSVLAAALPLIGFVYHNWGFDILFRILSGAALVILLAVALLPRRLPTPETAPAAAE